MVNRLLFHKQLFATQILIVARRALNLSDSGKHKVCQRNS